MNNSWVEKKVERKSIKKFVRLFFFLQYFTAPIFFESTLYSF